MAKIGTQPFGETIAPSRERISENSGFFATIPMALAVSILDPPPMATIQSAPLFLKASRPFFTLSMVGLGWISLKTSYAILASSKRSVTFFVTPNLIKPGSLVTKAF